MLGSHQIQLSRLARDSEIASNAGDLQNVANTPEARAAVQNKTTFEADPKDVNFQKELVLFDVSPTVSESRTAEYADHGLPGPTGILVYTVTQNRRFAISARFISRTVAEASRNYTYVNLLRSWLLPHSNGTAGQSATIGRPPVVRLNGYGGQFHDIPVVLSELSINYPEEVDYIETDIAMIPIIQGLDLTLIEAHGRAESLSDLAVGTITNVAETTFDLAAFKKGTLRNY